MGAGGEAFDWGSEESEESEGGEPDVLRFQIGDAAFAVETVHVSEVSSPLPVTDVPGLPDYVVGVAVRRRHVLTVIDLSTFLDLPPRRRRSRSRLLIFDVGGLEAGALVDSVTGLELWPDDSESQRLMNEVSPRIRPFTIGARWAPGGVVILLDAAELIRSAAVR